MAASFRQIGLSKSSVAVGSRPEFGKTGAVNYTLPLLSRTYGQAALADEFGNIDMNVAPGLALQSLLIYDGGDVASTFTPTALQGASWDFVATTNPNQGTFHVEAASTNNNDLASFADGANTYNLGSYQLFECFIKLNSWPSQGTKEVFVSFFNDGASVSDEIGISSYISTTNLATYQLCQVPMSAFTFSGASFDEIRLRIVDNGPGSAPTFDIDDINMVEPGQSGTVEYTFQPLPTELFEIRKLEIVAVAGSDKVKYDKFFSLTQLTNGLQISWERGGLVEQNLVITRDWEWATSAASLEIIPDVSDVRGIYRASLDLGPDLVQLKGTTNDRVVIRVRDDLSSLLEMSATVQGAYITLDFEE